MVDKTQIEALEAMLASLKGEKETKPDLKAEFQEFMAARQGGGEKKDETRDMLGRLLKALETGNGDMKGLPPSDKSGSPITLEAVGKMNADQINANWEKIAPLLDGSMQ